MTKVMLGRMIDDVGVGRAVEGWLNAGSDDVDAVVERFVAKKSARGVLRTLGLNSRALGGGAEQVATEAVSRLLEGNRQRFSVKQRRLLRSVLMHTAETGGRDSVVSAVVEAGRSVVLRWTWEAESVGSNGTEEVKRVAGRYWFRSEESDYTSAPYRSLADAISHDENLVVNATTQSIEVPSLRPDDLARLLRVSVDTPVGHVCRLNGKPWCVGESRTLVKQERALP